MNNFTKLDQTSSTPRPSQRRPSKQDSWEPISPVPIKAPLPPKLHPTRGRPSASWSYMDCDGNLMMIVCRFDKQGGGKDIIPLTYCQRHDDLEWRWKGLPVPRPLYGLDELASAKPNAGVLICEGEKATDAARYLFPDYVVMTWPNGSKAVDKTTWEPLARRHVVLWPDADAPGNEAMARAAKCLNAVAVKSIRLVNPPSGVPKGWDVADALAEIVSGTRDRDAVLSLVVDAVIHEVTGETKGELTGSDEDVGNSRRPAVPELLEAVGEIELWHTPTGVAWATVWNGKGFANYPLNAPRFETWLVHRLMKQGHDAPGRESMGKILSMFQARAVYDCPEYKALIRVAGSLTDAVYLDMGGPDWRALKLTPDGWEVIDRPPVKFRRGSGMRSLPMPDRDGSIDDLRAWINCQSDGDWMLCFCWIMAALCPDGPFPILVLSGPPGAAKSTTAKIVRFFVDPSEVPLSRTPKDPRDLFASVQNSRILCYDNLSRIPAWLSDDLCMIATGSAVRERQFHTNTGEVLIEGGCPIIVNGIGDLATRSDLADRSLLVNLVPPTKRRAEYHDTNDSKALWPEFELALPKLMGGILDVFCAAMKHFDSGIAIPNGNPRMMDFAVWANAVGQAMGWEPDAFDNAYKGNRSEADEVALEDSPLWSHLQAVFSAGDDEWMGTATELKEKFLMAIEGTEKRKRLDKMMPSTLASHLQRVMPVLNKMGWSVCRPPRRGTGRRWIITPPEHTD